MIEWNNSSERTVLRTDKPQPVDADSFHGAIDAIGTGIPYSVRWEGETIEIFFDVEPSQAQKEQIVNAIQAYDGTEEQRKREQRVVQEEQEKVLRESRKQELKAKIVGGQTLTPQELSEIIGFLL